MSHDTDKLIRQLSLVAFLMAERRPLTARDVQQHVEGYSEMSDEAFARRFYSDRAELHALGVPLQSQRDEFTGEELYTLRSEQYFLPPLDLSDDELATLQTYLYALEGRFAYAEPLRLALQNLALGRMQARPLPRPPAVADRRDRGRGAHRGRTGHGVVGRARVREPRPVRGRRLRDRVLEHPAARGLGAAAGRPGGTARAGGAPPRGDRGARARAREPRG